MAFNVMGIRLEEAPDGVIPICPNCKERLSTIWVKTQIGIFRREILVCPHCEVFLGHVY